MLDTPGWKDDHRHPAMEGPRRTLAELVAEASSRILRLAPSAVPRAIALGAALIDIRADADRARDGIVPGSIHIPRTVLEWRLAPDSSFRTPFVKGLDQRIVLLCDHGCSSIFAAAMLVELGFAGAGDVVGGFAAWREARMPTIPAPPRSREARDRLPGMGPPDRSPISPLVTRDEDDARASR
jgi:rhodanese-related sulfurtransferase